MPNHTISAVLFRDGESWVAQCVEYDIATQANTLEDIYYELGRVLVGHLVVADELKRAPFENIPPAPQKFWDAFHDGAKVELRTLPFGLPKGQLAPRTELRLADISAPDISAA